MKTKVAKLIFSLSLVAAFSPQLSSAQILLSSGTYTQNFDTLATNGTANVWADNTTLPGWFAAKQKGTGSPTISTYRANTMTSGDNAGAIFSYGLLADSNRALGSQGSGTPGTQFYGVSFTNDTANALINFTISYTGEQWRNGGNTSTQKLAFTYRVATDATISSVDVTNLPLWTAFSALDFSSPTVGATSAALDGTQSTNQAVFANIVLTGVALQPGQALFIRWADIDDSGNDHGLGIDNVTVSFTPTAPQVVPAYVITQPTNQAVYLGDSASFSILAGGGFPFTYQWYFTNSSGVNPLADQTNSSLSLSFVTNNQAGGYFCAVTNSGGGTNSQIANLTVGIRTPIVKTIAELRTLMNPTTFAPTDTTNLYTTEGIVTTFVNMTGGTPSTNAQFYMQDGAAGITVFIRGGIASLPAVGDRVSVTGPLNQFRGQFELDLNALNPAHTNFIVNSGNTLPAPVIFNLANAGNAAYMKSIESSLVVVSNVYMQTSSGSGYFVANNTVNMTNLNGNVFPIFVNAYVPSVIAGAIPVFADSVTGVMAQFVASGSVYTNGFQLVMRQGADLVPGTAPILPIPLTYGYSAGDLTLQWADASFTLQSSTNVAGPYIDVPGATSPFTTNAPSSSVPALFFRLYHAP